MTVAHLRELVNDSTREPHAEVEFANGWFAIPHRDGAILCFPSEEGTAARE
jgi:hypothetical protein